MKGPSFLRTAHGNGAPALLRVERPPLDELPTPNAADTARGLAEAHKRGRPFQKGNRAASNRKPSLCLLGVPLETADPRYRNALRKAEAWRQRRVRELAVQGGGELGAGPCSMLANAAFALAASRVLQELAGHTLDATLFVQAARLADSARQQELTAVALAEREAEARRAARQVPSSVPWLVEADAREGEP